VTLTPGKAVHRTLEDAVERIAGRAGELDRAPRFPHENLEDLRQAHVLLVSAQTLRAQIALVRQVAAADASTARILDGHLNGVERLVTCAAELGEDEFAAVASGGLLIGVWGADPRGDEGDPAQLVEGPDGAFVLRGVKVFCSGAGGVARALVVAADPLGARRLVYIDTAHGLQIDRDWYRASGLRSSESHRVVFRDVPVLAVLGEPDELLREPYFARDGVRTVATWAGLSDAIFAATLAAVADADCDAHQDAALGRMRVQIRTIDLWLEHAGKELGGDPPDPDRCSELALGARVAIADASRGVSAAATQICGSRANTTLAALDRARRDLEIFLLQHRLERQLEGLGRTMRKAGR
jgi:alkylation response protein AidB-like acyl-CoA dehydrogenase